MKEKARVAILAVFIAVLSTAALPSATAMADSSPDYAVPLGHFYSQANGLAAGNSGVGFSITDEEGIPFWIAYRQFGGPDVLGYPISQRFVWDGHVCQATQRAIMQWNEEKQVVQLANLMDYMSSIGKDDWLRTTYIVPLARNDPSEAQKSFGEIRESRLKLLTANKALSAYYLSVPDPVATFGLPTSEVVDSGAFYVIRTQRTALFQCKEKFSWCEANSVAVMPAGEVVRAAGLLPADAVTPQEIPQERYTPSSRFGDREVTGQSTWYGWAFHGRVMRNGEIYDMYNPSIAACNIYPLGTLLRVTNLDTGAYIYVRVTDTGGFGWPIVIDLSYGAFSQLAHPDQGRMSVSIQPVDQNW